MPKFAWARSFRDRFVEIWKDAFCVVQEQEEKPAEVAPQPKQIPPAHRYTKIKRSSNLSKAVLAIGSGSGLHEPRRFESSQDVVKARLVGSGLGSETEPMRSQASALVRIAHGSTSRPPVCVVSSNTTVKREGPLIVRHVEQRTDEHVGRQVIDAKLNRPLMPRERDPDLSAADKSTR